MPPFWIVLACTVIACVGCSSVECADGFSASGDFCITTAEIPIICDPPCNMALHEVCGGTFDEAECACAPGYAGSPCEWAGGLLDPGLQDDAAWTTSNGAAVLAFDEDVERDRGKAFIEDSAACNGGAVSQEIEMPPYEAADPFVVEITYRTPGAFGMAVGFDRAWKKLPPVSEWETTRFCVGEAAYGGDVAFRLASSEKAPNCLGTQTPTQSIEVDRVEIQVATEEDACPAPGEVANGEADPDGGGWDFEVDELGEAFAGFADDLGEPVVRLYSETGSAADRAAMTTTVSVPLRGEGISPALRFRWEGEPEVLFQTELGTSSGLDGNAERTLGTLLGTGAEQNALYCLPPWTHGNVVDLSFQMLDLTGSGETELIVDGIEVVSDGRCGDSFDLHDPGFESAPVDWPGAAMYVVPDQSFEMVSDSGRARSGNGFMEITYWTTEAFVIFETFVLVPPADENGGPQVSFYSNVPPNPSVPIRWFVGIFADLEGDLPQGGGWRLVDQLCLPPEWVDRWYRVQVWVGPGTSAPVSIEPETVRLDDISVGTSPACESE